MGRPARDQPGVAWCLLPAFLSTDDAVQRALSLLFVSLAVIGAVVVLLGARLVTVHRDGEYAMMRARGAGLRQITLVALRGGAVTVLPAAAVGVAGGHRGDPGARGGAFVVAGGPDHRGGAGWSRRCLPRGGTGPVAWWPVPRARPWPAAGSL